MKKRINKMVVLTTLLAVISSTSAMAGWVKTPDGDAFQNSDGTFNYMKWFTDPETGYEYYADPSGNILRDTYVETYYLDENGIKREQSEALRKASEERERRESANGNPNLAKAEAKKAELAAKEAVKAGAEKIIVSNTRLSYQAEADAYFTKLISELYQKIKGSESGVRYVLNTSKNNYETIYYAKMPSEISVLDFVICKASNPKLRAYTESAVEIRFNRNIAGDDTTYFDEIYKEALICTLGNQEGTKVYDLIHQQEIGTDARIKEEGITDSGNRYTFDYGNNNAKVNVICSEVIETMVASGSDASEVTAVEQDGN